MKFCALFLLLAVPVMAETQVDTSQKATPEKANFLPYFNDDFESGADSSRLSPLYDAAGRSRISAEKAKRGKQSARMEIRSGDAGGFGQWGAVLPIRPVLTKGQEIWVRLYVYWPANFEFSATPWMKFLRFHTRSADGKNRGYNDLYIDRAEKNTSVLRTIKEMHDKWAVYNGPSIAREKWERYEMYLSLDDVPADAGGKGRVRIWRDGNLIFNRGDVPTLSAATDVLDSFYLFTYWNNETPPNNHCYIDDLTIATSASPPPQRDAADNPMIGDWSG